jgi:hypothetical protein
VLQSVAAAERRSICSVYVANELPKTVQIQAAFLYAANESQETTFITKIHHSQPEFGNAFFLKKTTTTQSQQSLSSDGSCIECRSIFAVLGSLAPPAHTICLSGTATCSTCNPCPGRHSFCAASAPLHSTRTSGISVC